MGKDTKIAWTNSSFNIVLGCQKVSEGCANCYAEAHAQRYGWQIFGPGATRRTLSDTYWKAPLDWNEWAGENKTPWRVFCGSMCDIGENNPQLDEPRARLWDTIRATPHLTWLLLTKRIVNLKKILPTDWPFKNVWLGASAENQANWDMRVPVLMDVPAAVHFVSVEPMIGPVEMKGLRPEWVIIGGESGPHARGMDPSWAIDLIKEARDQYIPVFFKQEGAVLAKQLGHTHPKGEDPTEWGPEFQYREFPHA